MENKELVTLFQEIDKSANCFDRFLALKKARKNYRKSKFYKTTRMPIRAAYKIYKLNSLHILCAFANSAIVQGIALGDFLPIRLEIEKFLADFDVSKIDRILDHIGEKIEDLSLNTTDINGELNKIVKEFKNTFIK